jgi:hypothetical protein
VKGKVDYIAGGAALNTARVAQVFIYCSSLYNYTNTVSPIFCDYVNHPAVVAPIKERCIHRMHRKRCDRRNPEEGRTGCRCTNPLP